MKKKERKTDSKVTLIFAKKKKSPDSKQLTKTAFQPSVSLRAEKWGAWCNTEKKLQPIMNQTIVCNMVIKAFIRTESMITLFAWFS